MLTFTSLLCLSKSCRLSKDNHSIVFVYSISSISCILFEILSWTRNFHTLSLISCVETLSWLRNNCSPEWFVLWINIKSIFIFWCCVTIVSAWPWVLLGWIIKHWGIGCIRSEGISCCLSFYETLLGIVSCRAWDTFISWRIFFQVYLKP